MAQMRLDKFLGEMGLGTRSQVKELARKGRVAVNGQAVKKSDQKIWPGKDEVQVDGKTIPYVPWEYYLLNKPQGVVSATEDGRYPTVVDLIAEKKRKDLFPVGRLDKDTEGLLLITNDGIQAHQQLSPGKHVEKTYFVRMKGALSPSACRQIQEGLVLEDGQKTLPAKLHLIRQWREGEGIWAEPVPFGEACLTIHEGKFHQVKRMFEAVGCQVVYLKRLSMGPLTLDENMEPGQYRPLTSGELAELKALEGERRTDG